MLLLMFWLFHVFLPQRAGNGIGEAAGKAIADALNVNKSLTSIDLEGKLHLPNSAEAT